MKPTNRTLYYEGKMMTVTKMSWSMARNVTHDDVIEYGMALKIGNEKTPEGVMEMHVEHELAPVLFIDEDGLRHLRDGIEQALLDMRDERVGSN